MGHSSAVRRPMAADVRSHRHRMGALDPSRTFAISEGLWPVGEVLRSFGSPAFPSGKPHLTHRGSSTVGEWSYR
jgi:hypothetical protein